ncbi:MAG: NAD(P)-dependent oxidoreductase [Eubacteriales bacterium]|nr:NAD(P)-dependent oxidoreductase [Eubacteriales bacterium]
MKKIGFVGIGVMGGPMALNLMKNGYELQVYTRTKEKAHETLAAGARWCDSPGACAQGVDAVITMVGYPADVEEVYFSPDGILPHTAAGTYLIDMTTTSPQLSKRIYATAKEKGLFALDAPVSGGDVGARNATLSIMAGGDPAAYHACRPLLACMGSNIIYEGPAGCGQHTKMANQIAIGGAISGVCEALIYAKKAGLDLQTLLDSISKGAAGSWQMSNNAPRILKDDYEPGFFIKHFIKDMDIACSEAEQMELTLEVLPRVLEMYRSLAQEGMEDCGTQALIRHYDPDF